MEQPKHKHHFRKNTILKVGLSEYRLTNHVVSLYFCVKPKIILIVYF